MAKYETRLRGDFDETLRYLHDGILDKSASASYEDESCVQFAGVRCCVRAVSYTHLGRTQQNPSYQEDQSLSQQDKYFVIDDLPMSVQAARWDHIPIDLTGIRFKSKIHGQQRIQNAQLPVQAQRGIQLVSKTQ